MVAALVFIAHLAGPSFNAAFADAFETYVSIICGAAYGTENVLSEAGESTNAKRPSKEGRESRAWEIHLSDEPAAQCCKTPEKTAAEQNE
jgi:hypothetical protein